MRDVDHQRRAGVRAFQRVQERTLEDGEPIDPQVVLDEEDVDEDFLEVVEQRLREVPPLVPPDALLEREIVAVPLVALFEREARSLSRIEPNGCFDEVEVRRNGLEIGEVDEISES